MTIFPVFRNGITITTAVRFSKMSLRIGDMIICEDDAKPIGVCLLLAVNKWVMCLVEKLLADMMR